MAGKVSGRIKRAISSSLILMAVAAVLAVSNVFVQNRDKGLALGPNNKDQLEFFIKAVDRPDISAFFKRLKAHEKLKTAQNVHAQKHPKMVRLAAIWLTDFDPDARKELQAALVDLAPKYPKEIAEELKNTGGFQKLAVFAALKASFEKTLPYAIDQLGVAAARPNAIEYLVSSSEKIGPAVAAKLDDKDKDTRLAAADALGKLGYRAAGPKIKDLYETAEGGDKTAYLAALSNLGDPSLEPLFAALLRDPGTNGQDRANAILGLGRMASKPAIDALWRELQKNPLDAPQIIEALSLAGDGSLLAKDAPPSTYLEVAGGIKSIAADRVIASALKEPALADRAAELSAERSGLVQPLVQRLLSLDPDGQGRFVEKTVKALSTTEQGKKALSQPALMSRFGGFIRRQLSQS